MRIKNKYRLIADRLCYLAEGMDGLRYRHGMQRAYKASGLKWWDKYDTEAEKRK